MEAFLSSAGSRRDQIDEQIIDLLESLSDFKSFKEMMLFSRAHLVATTPKLKSGKAAALGLKDGSKPQQQQQSENGLKEEDLKRFEECIDKLQVSGYQSVLHEDDEEGEERPDLNLDIRKV